MAKPTRFTQDVIDEYLSKGYWTGELTSEIWDKNAQLYPEREALIDSRSRLTWSQVKQRSDRIALGLLELGYQKDELIFMLVPNCNDSFVWRLACEKTGILCMTSLMTLREAEIEHILKNYDVAGIAIPWQFRRFDYFETVNAMRPSLPALRHIFISGDKVPPGTNSIDQMAERPIERDYPADYLEKSKFSPTEVAIIGLTSGTTGLPKTAEHMISARIALGEAYHLMPKLTGDDVVFNVINAIAGLGAAFCYSVPREAAKTVLLEVWEPKEAMKIIQKERATVFLTTPAQLAMTVRDPELSQYDVSSLRCVCCSTSPLTYEIAVEAEERLGIPVLNTYGTFDGGGISKTTIDDDAETRRRTVGKPHLGTDIKLLDDEGKEVAPGEDGELYFRGPATTAGYFQDMERTLETWGALGKDGWFRTGDQARFDSKGNIVLTGRKKDMIIRGGQNIYPAEIEGILLMHPKVKHVAIVPMPDPIMGEKACAYVAPEEGQEFTFDEMVSFLKTKKIASYKLPERLETRSELPMRDSQKVAKASLREDIAQKLKAEGKI